MIRTTSRISFHQLKKIDISRRLKLKDFILSKATSEGKQIASIDFIFCDDDYLLSINKQFLNHDDLTDIITFDLSEDAQVIVSEIYISVDRVVENATHYNIPVINEVHRVIFHGVLHLCGYNDKTERDKTEMRLMEAKWLSEYFN